MAKGVKELQAREPKFYEQYKDLSIKETEKTFNDFGVIDNQYLGKTAFPKSFARKILHHKGFPTATIVKHFDELYSGAVFLKSEAEKEYPNRQHKKHSNIAVWHILANKFKTGKGEYYIRFTVKEGKPQKNNKKSSDGTNNLLHSSFISDIGVYQIGNGQSAHAPGIVSPDIAALPIDKMLQEIFDKAKDVSACVLNKFIYITLPFTNYAKR